MLRETWLVFVRSFLPVVRNPVAVIFGLSQPLLFLALFGPLLGAGAWQWFVPGLLVQMSLFGTAYAGFTLMAELKTGVVERMRVTPISRTALLVGRVAKDVVLLVVQAIMIIVPSLFFGFRAPVSAILLGLALVAVIGVAVSAASYTLALTVKLDYVFTSVLSAVVMPLMLLSGVMLPMSLGPDWLYTLSRLNPLSHVVDAERAIFMGGSTLPGILVASGLVILSVFWGVRTFYRESS